MLVLSRTLLQRIKKRQNIKQIDVWGNSAFDVKSRGNFWIYTSTALRQQTHRQQDIQSDREMTGQLHLFSLPNEVKNTNISQR